MTQTAAELIDQHTVNKDFGFRDDVRVWKVSPALEYTDGNTIHTTDHVTTTVTRPVDPRVQPVDASLYLSDEEGFLMDGCRRWAHLVQDGKDFDLHREVLGLLEYSIN